ncbi:hypothetical protein [uncultured Marinobacter sp.]|uniref:hypothetical protein n=1 Tax=uncultured Marinobacter sp. TaxID=187379 RepID=UPI002588D7C3|nr:hypothetical protein [uncultured Marinobacter sp.]
MALETRGLMDGAMQGFGLMDRYYQRQEQDERAERGLQMREESFQMQKDQYADQQEEAERKRDLENIQFTLGKISQGMGASEEELQTLQKYPKFWKALEPETDRSIEIAQAVIDPDDPMDVNSPEALAAINQMFEPEINKGEGGQKRIVGVYPGPDGETVTFDLEVVGEDGKPYNAPMTSGRAPGGDEDEVMQVPMDKIIEQVQGMRLLRNTMRTPQAQEAANQVLSILTGNDGRVKGIEINDRLANPYTGEVMADFRDQGGEGGGSGLESSYLNLAERIARNTMGKFNSETGAFLGFPEGTNRDYLMGVTRAEELMEAGVSPIKATSIGMLSVTGTLEKSKARQLATEEAQDQSFGMFGGEKRTAWIKQRTEEIMQESNTALDEYYRITGKQKPERTQTDSRKGEQADQAQDSGSDTPANDTETQRAQPSNQDGMGGASGRVQREAPQAAVEYLRNNVANNPQLRDAFKEKYGYLPEGI